MAKRKRDSDGGTVGEKKQKIDPADMEISPPTIKRNVDNLVNVIRLNRGFASSNTKTKLHAIFKLKELLSNGHMFFVHVVLQHGFISNLVMFLEGNPEPALLLASLSLIGDIALISSEAVEIMIEKEAIVKITNVALSSADVEISVQGVRTLGNIAARSPAGHRKVTEVALLPLLCLFVKTKPENVAAVNNLTWTLRIINMVAGPDQIEGLNLPAILTLLKEIMSSKFEQYILSCCDLLTFITNQGRIHEIMESNILHLVVKLAEVSDNRSLVSVQKKLFGVLALICSKATKPQIRKLVEVGVIQCTNPRLRERSLADITMRIIYAILLDGGMPNDEPEQDHSSLVSPYSQIVKLLDDDLENLKNVTKDRAFHNVISILKND